jgi:Kef-type K+ transport system membrane component KefB
MKKNQLILSCISLFWISISTAFANEISPESIQQYARKDPFSFVLLEFAFIILLALIGQIISKHYQWPKMLGELLAGLIIGNILYWLDFSPVFYLLMHLGDATEVFKNIWTANLPIVETIQRFYDPDRPESMAFAEQMAKVFTTDQSPALIIIGIALWIFSNFGVFFLLFKLGLETRPEDILKKAEPIAYLVSFTGTLTPFLFGLGFSLWLMPNLATAEHVFLAAALCTTSAGLATHLFNRFHRLQSQEAQIVIQAAYIDDIFGVFLLSFIGNVVLSQIVGIPTIIAFFIYSALIFVLIIVVGKWVVSYIPRIYDFNESHTVLLIPLAMVFFVSWLADLFSIGQISSAFLAGMILNKLNDKRDIIKGLINTFEQVFAPAFFVFVGMQINLELFTNTDVLLLTLCLFVAATAGKIAAGYVALQNNNALAIGIGMIPRGEAVLIFISMSKILGVMDDTIFTVLATIVLLSNFITPWALEFFCTRHCQSDSFALKQ